MPIADHQNLTRHFFRGVNSTPLFRRFFEAFGVWTTMALGDDAGPGEIATAWDELKCPNREAIEESLQRVNDLSHPKARFAVLYRAKECNVPDYLELTPEKRAMTLFLDHRRDFDVTYEFHSIEKTENLHILMGGQPVPCAPTLDQVEALRCALKSVLYEDAMGDRLLIEPAPPHSKKWMAAIPHQTHAKADHEFKDDGSIGTRDRRPVLEMVLIYYPEKRVLKLKVGGRSLRRVEDVASCFAVHALGQRAGFFQVREIVRFAPILDPAFSFPRLPEHHFVWAKPTMIEYQRRGRPGVDYTVHCRDVNERSAGALELLAKDGIGLSEIVVTKLGICFKFPGGVRETRTVELSTPNRTSLGDAERDRHIERALIDWRLIDYAMAEPAGSAVVA